MSFLVEGFIRLQKYMKRVDFQRSDHNCCKDRWSWLNRVGWSVIVVWDKGLLVRNRVMGGHPVANQGVARMDKQNKQPFSQCCVSARRGYVLNREQKSWFLLPKFFIFSSIKTTK